MYETLRIVQHLKPKYVIWENVKNILSKRHKHNFDNYINKMKELGYTSFYQILNAKDYGIPQNRERVFTISIKNYEFPQKQKLTLKLEDLLEENVNTNYYLSEEQIKKIQSGISNKTDIKNIEVADYRYDEGVRIRKNGLAPCLTTKIGSSSLSSNTLLIKNNTKKGYLEAEKGDGIYINTTTKRGTVQKKIIPTLTSFQDKGVVLEDLKIRKLTPKECFRLMGFDDTDYEKAKKVNSNSQLYKQTGNSIVVNILEEILKRLLM